MEATETGHPGIHCREDSILTAGEKRRFAGFLAEHGLSEDIFLFFESLVGLSTERDRFLFVKAMAGDELVGVGMFARIGSHSLYHSLSARLRRHTLLGKLAGMMRSTVYFSMHAVSSPGLPRSFLYTEPGHREAVNRAILAWAREREDADAVIIFDSAGESELYSQNSFACLPFASDSWLDVTRYERLEDYLSLHKPTRKKLSRFRRRRKVEVETLRGRVPEETMKGISACLACSYRHSKGILPIQDFFNRNLWRTALFESDRFVHFVIRVDGRIAGFSTRLLCNRNLIGIIGGYDREASGNSPVYDFMIATTLQYCLENGFTRLVYGIVDNHTKARLMDSFREQKLYFYSGNRVQRWLMTRGYRFLSGYDLHRIDAEARGRRATTRAG